MPGGDHIPLDKLSGEIRNTEGSSVPVLWFLCPECGGDHYHMVPFHDGETFEDEHLGKVWSQKLSPGGLDALTLTPSYNSDCLHCFIKNGVVEVL